MKNIYLFVTFILIASTSAGSKSKVVWQFSESNKTVHWTGDFISGTVEYMNSDRQGLKVKSIDLELIGRLAYKYVSDNLRNNGKRTGTKTFLHEKVKLNSTSIRDSSKLLDGTNKWPFRFFLNDSYPPSVKQRKSFDSYIYYYLKIVLVRPEWYKRNIKEVLPIVVKHRSPPIISTKVEVQETNRKDVHIHVALQKSFVAIGKNVSFDLTLKNPKENLIDRLSVALVQELKLGPNQEKSRNIVEENLKPINQFKKTDFHGSFQLHIPQEVPPTFLYQFPPKAYEPPLAIGYQLHFEVHIHGSFNNMHLKLPLILTDHP